MHRISPFSILRRLYPAIALSSAAIFFALIACFVRAHFTTDRFLWFIWNPRTRTFTQIRLRHASQGMIFHSESTTALPSDNTAYIQAMVGPSNALLVHTQMPLGLLNGFPLLWGDHYQSTPTSGINKSGVADCWDFQFRYELPLAMFALLPTIWAAQWYWRYRRRKRDGARGFDVITTA
jgi:hypothetical protein